MDAATARCQGGVGGLGVSEGVPVLSGFAPIEGERALVLVLGTMPSVRSLADAQYYAFPRNAFWKVMEMFGGGADAPYAERCERLRGAGIAVWDVLRSCERPSSSLDRHIRKPKPNDLASFRRRHLELRAVLLNGAAAGRYFRRFVGGFDGVEARVMPSTSPAFAREGKVETWRRTLAELLGERD